MTTHERMILGVLGENALVALGGDFISVEWHDYRKLIFIVLCNIFSTMKALCLVLDQYIMILSGSVFPLKFIIWKLWSRLRKMAPQLESHTEVSKYQSTHIGCSQEPKLLFQEIPCPEHCRHLPSHRHTKNKSLEDKMMRKSFNSSLFTLKTTLLISHMQSTIDKKLSQSFNKIII